MVHIIHPSKRQIYHSFDFHRNPHYGVQMNKLPLFKCFLKSLQINFKDYESNTLVHRNRFITIQNNIANNIIPFENIMNLIQISKLNTRQLQNNFISYGYSGRNRKRGGPPVLTKSIKDHGTATQHLLPLLLNTLTTLSVDLISTYGHRVAPNDNRSNIFSRKMGSNFGYDVNALNVFEGMDCSIFHHGKNECNMLYQHCDVMNDWRRGYNYVSVAKCLFRENTTMNFVTLSVICYTRKLIGDFLSRK